MTVTKGVPFPDCILPFWAISRWPSNLSFEVGEQSRNKDTEKLSDQEVKFKLPTENYVNMLPILLNPG